MPDYELIRHIRNRCQRNQLRDVAFQEITCDDPVDYVRTCLPDLRELTVQRAADGSVTVLARTAELEQEFHFTPL